MPHSERQGNGDSRLENGTRNGSNQGQPLRRAKPARTLPGCFRPSDMKPSGSKLKLSPQVQKCPSSLIARVLKCVCPWQGTATLQLSLAEACNCQPNLPAKMDCSELGMAPIKRNLSAGPSHAHCKAASSPLTRSVLKT